MSLINYIQDSRAELKHVNWPNRRQAIISTIAVVVVSAAVAAYLGFFDYIFSTLLTNLIG
jgi:preprotein translocase SecE subunit